MTVVGIVGPQGSGKTTAAQELGVAASRMGWKVAGILAPVVYEGTTRVGYDIVDVSTGRRASWLRSSPHPTAIGPFSTVRTGEILAREALGTMLTSGADLALLDELGEWELGGGGHRWAADRLGECTARVLVVVMRDTVLDRAKIVWGIPERAWHPREVGALADAVGLKDR